MITQNVTLETTVPGRSRRPQLIRVGFTDPESYLVFDTAELAVHGLRESGRPLRIYLGVEYARVAVHVSRPVTGIDLLGLESDGVHEVERVARQYVKGAYDGQLDVHFEQDHPWVSFACVVDSAERVGSEIASVTVPGVFGRLQESHAFCDLVFGQVDSVVGVAIVATGGHMVDDLLVAADPLDRYGRAA